MSALLITPLYDVTRRDLELADTDLSKPLEADALEQGEWVTYDSNAKAIRVGVSSVNRAWMVWTEKGDYSAQGLGRIAVLFQHDFEVETDMFVGTPAVGAYVTVKQITVDTVTRAGFAVAVQGTDHVYGTVTKTAATNGGKLRVQCSAPFDWPVS